MKVSLKVDVCGGDLVMNLKRVLPAILTGYLIAVLLGYFILDYFSWGLVVGSILSVVLFALIITIVRKRTK